MRKQIIRLLCSTVCLSLIAGQTGCGTTKEETTGLAGIDRLFEQTELHRLQAVAIPIRSADLADFGYLTCVDSLLILNGNYGDYSVAVFDLHSGSRVNRLAFKGKAENEFLQIGDLAGRDEGVMLFGRMPSRAVWIPKPQLTDSFPDLVSTDLAFEQGDYLSLAPIAGGRYIATGRFSMPESRNHQFALVGPDGRLQRTFEDYLLNDEIAELPNYNLAYGYQGNFAVTPNGKNGLYSGWNHAVWRFYDFSGEQPRKVREYAFVLPCFSPRDGARYGVQHVVGKSIGGSLCATASDSHYYLLFSEKPYGTYDAYFADRIYIFDLQGNPTGRIELDREVIAIAYWAGQHALIGCATDAEGEPQIVKFDLPF